MTARPLTLLAVAAGLSIAVMTLMAASGQGVLSGIAAGAVAVLLIIASWMANSGGARDGLAATNAGLIALGYGWGGVTLIAIYSLSGVWWQHGRQYGSGMVVIALLLALYARAAGSRSSSLMSAGALRWARIATLLHGVAAVGGLVFLVGSGKLASVKGDWPANQIFFAGGVALALASFIAYAFGGRDEGDALSGS